MSSEQENLNKQLDLHRRNLASAEGKAAAFGKLHTPGYIEIEIEETRKKIAEIEAQLVKFPNTLPARNHRLKMLELTEAQEQATQDKNWQKAAELGEDILTHDPNDQLARRATCEAYANMGNLQVEQQRYRQAIVISTRAIELDSNFYAGYHNRGLAYRELGYFDKALWDFEVAIRLEPIIPTTYNERGVTYTYQQKYQEALADFSKAVKLKPDYGLAWTNCGFTQEKLGDKISAYTSYQMAKELGEAVEEQKLGELQIENNIKKLKDKEWNVRYFAVETLGKIGDARAVEPLIFALKDEQYRVRRVAAKALGNIGDTRAVEPLILAFKDEDFLVNESAIRAIGKIRDIRAVEPLILALKNEDSDVRGFAADALGKIGDSRVLPALEFLREDNGIYYYPPKTVGETASEAIRKIKEKNGLV